MKKSVLAASVVALLGLMVPAVPFAVSQVRVLSAKEKFDSAVERARAQSKNFTGVTVQYLDYQDCSPSESSQKPPARRRVRSLASDGSFSEEITELATGDVDHSVVLADGREIRAHDSSRVKVTWQTRMTPDSTLANRPDPDTQCLRTYLGDLVESQSGAIVGNDNILGYRTVKIVADGHDRRFTYWKSPELGCAVLQSLAEFKDPSKPGQPASTNFVTAERIDKGPVNPVHFTKSAPYRELKPSEYIVAVARFRYKRQGKDDAAIEDQIGRLKQEEREQHEKLDSRYEASHARLAGKER